MYAYTSILEETVRRRRTMWSWEHIKQHRSMKNKYREAYIQKLENKKVSSDLQKQLDVSCCSTSTSTSTWLHAAVNHDFCSAGGCVLKRIKRNDRKVRSEKKKRRFDRKGRRKIKFDQMHFVPSILSSLASLEVPGPTKSPPA